MFQEGVRPSLLKKKEKKIIRREIYTKKRIKKREKKKERVREPRLHTLKQHTHTNQEAAPLPFQAFATPLRLIRPPRSIVPTHEAGVSHAIIATIPRNPSFMLAESILR